MPDYTFHTLSSTDFEKLSRDLLQKKLELTLESFKPGRDQGVDLRYSRPAEGEKIIVQAKHWRESGFAKLYSHLKTKELPKIRKLKPSRYILATSVPFSKAEKDKLFDLLKPFVLSTGDILGKDDLNGLLGEYSEVESSHVKLWASSAEIIMRIVANAEKGRSDFTAERIMRDVSLYVPNKKYGEAVDILNEHQFLIVIGEPGIGKTVLARMIIAQLLKDGYELVKIQSDVAEGEKVWSNEARQVFWFDDFLGANYLALAEQKNSDSALTGFIERVTQDPKKRIILTSRTSVLRQAAAESQALGKPALDCARHEVKIESYDTYDKALILYNHLYFLGIDEEYLEKVRGDKNYWRIIRHRNFNPRLIEFITDPYRVGDIAPEKYMEFVLASLDNPQEVWRHPYTQQLDHYSQMLLQTLFSLGDRIEGSVLRDAFEARVDYEIRTGGFTREANAFDTRLHILLGGFLRSELDAQTGRHHFSFFNPSLGDFFLHDLNQHPGEKWRIISAVRYTSQLRRFMFSDNGYLGFEGADSRRLLKLLREKEDELVAEDGCPHIDLLEFYYLAFPSGDTDEDMARQLSSVDFNLASPLQASQLSRILDASFATAPVESVVNDRWEEIIKYLFESATDRDDLDKILELFEAYEKDFAAYIVDPSKKSIVEESVRRYLKDMLEQLSGFDGMTEAHEIELAIEETYASELEYSRRFGLGVLPELRRIRDIDPESVAEENTEQAQIDDYLADAYKEESRFEGWSEREMNQQVDELFG